jgi:hypothetical protein
MISTWSPSFALTPRPGPPIKAASPLFSLFGFVLSRGERRFLLINNYGSFEHDASQCSRPRRGRMA